MTNPFAYYNFITFFLLLLDVLVIGVISKFMINQLKQNKWNSPSNKLSAGLLAYISGHTLLIVTGLIATTHWSFTFTRTAAILLTVVGLLCLFRQLYQSLIPAKGLGIIIAGLVILAAVGAYIY